MLQGCNAADRVDGLDVAVVGQGLRKLPCKDTAVACLLLEGPRVAASSSSSPGPSSSWKAGMVALGPGHG